MRRRRSAATRSPSPMPASRSSEARASGVRQAAGAILLNTPLANLGKRGCPSRVRSVAHTPARSVRQRLVCERAEIRCGLGPCRLRLGSGSGSSRSCGACAQDAGPLVAAHPSESWKVASLIAVADCEAYMLVQRWGGGGSCQPNFGSRVLFWRVVGFAP